MFHAGYAAANYLKSKGAKKAYVLGPKKVCSELEEVGIDFEYKEVRVIFKSTMINLSLIMMLSY